MTHDTPPVTVIGWKDVDSNFGSALPYGSCNAILSNDLVCGWPRNSDGTCQLGHRQESDA